MKCSLAVAWILVVAASGCSDDSAAAPAGKGGSSGASATGGAAGSTSSTGGQAPVDGSIFDVPPPPSEPLCPRNGPIVAGPTPLPDGAEIVSPNDGAKFVTATDSYAYWASDTVIRRVAVSDNSETVLVDHTASPNSFQSLAIDGDTLYFSEVGFRDSLAVAKMPADGSGAPVKLADANSPWQIAVADGYVYYYDAGPNEIARVPVTGGTPTVLVRGVNPAGLTIANGYVYFVHPRTNNDVSNLLRVPVDAKAPDPDAGIDAGDGLVPLGAEIVAPTDNYHPDGPTSDANNLYYDDKLKVMRVSIAGGAPTMIAEATYEVGKIVPYGGKVYWSTEGCGDIVRSSIDGIERTTIVHFAAADRLAVNATHVYFIGFMRQLIRAPH